MRLTCRARKLICNVRKSVYCSVNGFGMPDGRRRSLRLQSLPADEGLTTAQETAEEAAAPLRKAQRTTQKVFDASRGCSLLDRAICRFLTLEFYRDPKRLLDRCVQMMVALHQPLRLLLEVRTSLHSL